jgi:hypothetical protein
MRREGVKIGNDGGLSDVYDDTLFPYSTRWLFSGSGTGGIILSCQG